MTRLIVNTIRSQGQSTVDFKDIISANGASQWLDSYGVIKANKNTIDEDVTIPAGTNGITAGTVIVSSGKTVTVQGEWRII
jgi:glycine/serine hydroxymethyltransferase